MEPDWQEVANLLDDLYKASDRLGEMFPGRSFTLDGHLVGSIGEVIAAYMFDLDLATASTKAHDAIAKDGRQVEIKLTQKSSTALRHLPEHLIVLQRLKGQSVEVIFNGPGETVWKACGKMQKNGQRQISISKLKSLQELVLPTSMLPLVRPPPV